MSTEDGEWNQTVSLFGIDPKTILHLFRFGKLGTLTERIPDSPSKSPQKMSFPVFLLTLVLYLMVLGTTVYFCVFADPNTSPTAYYLTETLPQKIWSTLERIVGPRMTTIVEFFVNRIMILTYCAVVFGSWSVIFAYVYPWIDAQTYLSHNHKAVGIVVFLSCITTWHWAHTSNPGIITNATVQRYDHFPYDELMYTAGRTCPTRNVPRLARSKYDRFKYHANIPRFDHFCGWVYNTIGEDNYRYFLLFLAVHVGMCWYGVYCVGCLFQAEIREKDLFSVTFFDKFTGDSIESNWWIVFQYLFFQFFAESSVFAVMVVMGVALGLFLTYHVWLTSRGLTTNEAFKWDSIQRWHKRELQHYKEALQRGDPVVDYSTTTGSSTPHVGDEGDVTCTPSNGPQPQVESKSDNKTNAVIHPGPRPVNMYNRGVMENWKEVLFPISTRKDRQKSKNT